MSYDLTSEKISYTYGRVVQVVSGSYYDGFGNVLPIGTSSVVLTGSTAGFATTGSNTFIGNQIISGSIIVVVNGITSSLNGTASYSNNSLYADTASYYNGSVISSSYSSTGTSASYAKTASYAPTDTNITASWSINSISSSYVNIAQTASYYNGSVISSSYALSSSYTNTSSYSNNSISASYTLTSSYAGVSNNSNSSSYSLSGSFSITASYALNGGGITLTTGSTYSITSSWSNNSLTASSINFTASNSIFSQTASYYDGNVTSASYSLSSSYAPTNTNVTSSWSNNSVSSSYSLTSSYTLNGGTILITGSSYPITSSWSVNSLTASNTILSQTASYVAANNVIGTVTSASYALSSSYAPINTSITASWSTNALTASSINFTASNAVFSLTSSYIGSGSNNYFPFWSGNKLSYNSLISQSINQISILSDTASFLGNTLVINKSDPFYLNNNPTIDASNSPNQTLMLMPNIMMGGNGNGESWNRFNSDGTVDFLGARIKFTSGGNAAFNSKITIGSTSLLGNNTLDVIGNISCSVITASRFFGTSSWSNNTLTASSINFTASNSTYAQSASYSLTASYLTTTNNYTVTTLNINSSGSTSASTNGSLTIAGQNTKGGSNYHDFLYTTNTVAGAVNPNKYFRQDNTGNFEIVNSSYGTTIFILTDSGSLQLPIAQAANVTQLRNTGAGLKINSLSLFDDGNPHIHNTNPNANFWINSSGSGNLIINGQSGATGGVGIGTSTMSGYVTINGGVNVTIGAYGYLTNAGNPPTGTGGGTTGTFSITCTQRIQATEFDATSDERLKNIESEIPLNEAIDLVNKVIPIKYKWKDGVDTGTKTGYSAQQVYKAGFDHLIGVVKKEGMEEIVDSDGFVNPKDAQFVMNYEQVTPYHSKLIKHLLDTIEKLEERLKILENK